MVFDWNTWQVQCVSYFNAMGKSAYRGDNLEEGDDTSLGFDDLEAEMTIVADDQTAG